MTIFIKRRTAFIVCMFGLGLGALFLGFGGITGSYWAVKSNDHEAVAKIVPPGPEGANTGQNMQDISALSEKAKQESDVTAFFVEYRMERERSRGQQVEWLRETINNPSTDTTTRQKAQEQLLTISGNMARESEVESLIRAKGYEDAAVCIDRKGVTVIVQSAELSQEDASRISDLVSRGTGVGEQGIIIIPKS